MGNYDKLSLPLDGDKIEKDSEQKLTVPNQPIIPVIEGDGIGRDIMKATRRVIDAAVQKVDEAEAPHLKGLDTLPAEGAIESEEAAVIAASWNAPERRAARCVRGRRRRLARRPIPPLQCAPLSPSAS